MGDEWEVRKLVLCIHIFLESNQETPTPGSQHLASPPASLLVHQASVLLHFSSSVCGSGQGGDSDPTLTVVLKIGCTFESSGELLPGPCPRTTESEPLIGKACALVFLKSFLGDFNEHPGLRTIGR